MSLSARLIGYWLTVLAITVVSLIVVGDPGWWALSLLLGTVWIVSQQRSDSP